VPHAWLLSQAAQKLRNFLEKGPSLDLVTDETLAARGDDIAQPTIARVLEEDDKVRAGAKLHGHGHAHKEEDEWKGGGPPPDANAESGLDVAWSVSRCRCHFCVVIPPTATVLSGYVKVMLWYTLGRADSLNQTIDRVLDVMLLPPKLVGKTKPSRPAKRQARIISESESETSKAETTMPKVAVTKRLDGIEPPPEDMMDIDTWETRTGRDLDEDDVDEVAGMVTWCFVSPDRRGANRLLCVAVV
jgi:hypothetical protein